MILTLCGEREQKLSVAMFVYFILFYFILFIVYCLLFIVYCLLLVVIWSIESFFNKSKIKKTINNKQTEYKNKK